MKFVVDIMVRVELENPPMEPDEMFDKMGTMDLCIWPKNDVPCDESWGDISHEATLVDYVIKQARLT